MNNYSQKRKVHILKLLMTVCLSLALSLGGFMACEGPAGPEGEQGPEGPVGPAGDNGSMIYSGQGVPDSDIGTESDYYLDTTSGELYGPKDSDGWGNPIIVLAGEDGEDGSQIFAGTGAPNSSEGANGDFYLDKDNYDMYGPKTDQGWGTGINLKGAEGNANVTRYIFPGYDFSTDTYNPLNIPIASETEMKQSAWLYYLIGQASPNVEEAYFSIPGYGIKRETFYSTEHYYYSNREEVVIGITRKPGASGEQYDRIEIIQIKANKNQDFNKQASVDIIPQGLDTSNYHEVAEYYGFE